MLKTGRTPAEERFAATQRKLRQVQKDKDKARQEVSAQVAQLRAQRLAKEARDRENIDTTQADAPAGEAQISTSERLPKAHRPQM